jgi:sortase A
VPPDNEPEPQTYHGRIQIPAIGLDAPFLEGIRISTLDWGPGHWPGTAMPGELGNVVVAGHRTSHNADFRNLDQLQPGDQVIFNLDDPTGVPENNATVPDPDTYTGAWYYEVAFVEVVDDEAMWITMPDYRHTATLFACHPPGSVAQRIVAHLDLVTVDGELVDPPRPSTTTSTVPAG